MSFHGKHFTEIYVPFVGPTSAFLVGLKNAEVELTEA